MEFPNFLAFSSNVDTVCSQLASNVPLRGYGAEDLLFIVIVIVIVIAFL